MRAELLCPKCHQPVRFQRVDTLKAAGDVGLSQLVHEGKGTANKNTLRTHILQMREQLIETEWTIAVDRQRPSRWFLAKRQQERLRRLR